VAESAFSAGKENAVGDGGCQPFEFHGIGYPLTLLLIGNGFRYDLPGMKYFVAGKILSVVATAA